MGQQKIGNLEIFVWEARLVNEITRVLAKNVTPGAIPCSYLCKGLIGSPLIAVPVSVQCGK